MPDFARLRTQSFANRGCELCAQALINGNDRAANEHHPKEIVNTIGYRNDGTIERIGWRIEARGDGARILHFMSPHGGLPWYSYDLDSLERRCFVYPGAREFVLCDGIGGYTRQTISATTLRRILTEFPPSHPMFANAAA